MPAPRWLAVCVTLAAMVTASPPGVLADQRALTVLASGLPGLGATLDDVRAMPLPEGQRLICGGDEDSPPLADPTLVQSQTGRAPGRVRFCTVVTTADTNAGSPWDQARIASLAGPARLWLVLVEQGGSGHYRLARVSLWANRTAWDKVAEALKDTLGPATTSGPQLLGWEDGQHETLMFLDPKDQDDFALSVSDLRLRKLLKSPGGAGLRGE